MRVRMTTKILGLLNGVAYPDAGQEWDVPDTVGANLCDRGYAEPVVVDKTEKAVPKKRSEKRG